MVQIKHKKTCVTKDDEEIDEAIDEFMRYFSQEKHDDLLDTNTDLFSAVEAHKDKMRQLESGYDSLEEESKESGKKQSDSGGEIEEENTINLAQESNPDPHLPMKAGWLKKKTANMFRGW